jgi:hypothetical protein
MSVPGELSDPSAHLPWLFVFWGYFFGGWATGRLARRRHRTRAVAHALTNPSRPTQGRSISAVGAGWLRLAGWRWRCVGVLCGGSSSACPAARPVASDHHASDPRRQQRRLRQQRAPPPSEWQSLPGRSSRAAAAFPHMRHDGRPTPVWTPCWTLGSLHGSLGFRSARGRMGEAMAARGAVAARRPPPRRPAPARARSRLPHSARRPGSAWARQPWQRELVAPRRAVARSLACSATTHGLVAQRAERSLLSTPPTRSYSYVNLQLYGT